MYLLLLVLSAAASAACVDDSELELAALLDAGIQDRGPGDGSADDGEVCEEGFVPIGGECVRDRCIALPGEPPPCGQHGRCRNGTQEQPDCDCDGGYEEEDGTCVRNPCLPSADEPAACDDNADCTYEGGGEASCACKAGFEGDGSSCERNACIQLAAEGPPCADNELCTPEGPGEKSCSCAPGFADCDGEVTTGCETDLATDAGHCGVCGLSCARGLLCAQGQCERRIVQVSLGYNHGLSLMPDGSVLGAGPGTLLLGAAQSRTPVTLNLPSARTITVSQSHACALRADDAGAACWGSNADYEIGSAARDDSYEEIVLAGIRAIAAAPEHTCLINAEGFVHCWGRGRAGELGDGVSRDATYPGRTFGETIGGDIRVPNVQEAIEITAGDLLSCALTNNGNVYCWGSDAGAAYASELVRDASGNPLGDATAVCGGARHACALRSDATVVCWGEDAAGQLGSDEVPAVRNRFVPVALQDVQAVTCGAQHSCALTKAGTVHCWGVNSNGQLGSGGTDPSTTPLPVFAQGLPPARAIYAGSGATGTCMELVTGQVYCWGHNYWGQLGIGDVGVASSVVEPNEIAEWP